VGILDRLYMPTTKDVESGNSVVRRWYKTITFAALSTAVQINDTEKGPPDLVRLIQKVTFNWIAGAAQTPYSANLLVQNPPGNYFEYVGGMPSMAVVGAFNLFTTVNADMLWMQGETLALAGYFSAGAASNSITAVMVGLEFPRGSLQR